MQNSSSGACFSRWLVAALALLLTITAAAADGDAKSPSIASRLDIIGARVHGQPPVAREDLSALEPVCELVMRHLKRGDDNPSLDVWYAQLKDSPLLDLPQYNMAKGALSFHHYCWAEIVRGRYYRERDSNKRLELAGYVISGHKWMIDNAQYLPKNWPYLYRLYINMGTGYLLQRNTTQAISAFLVALRLKPRYLRTYTLIADAYLKTGDKTSALAQVTEGLRYFPEAKGLKRRYDELGGKQPYPEPYVSETPMDPLAAPAEEPAQETPAKKDDSQNAGSADPAEPTAESKKENDLNVPSTSQPEDNPYCRFCP